MYTPNSQSIKIGDVKIILTWQMDTLLMELVCGTCSAFRIKQLYFPLIIPTNLLRGMRSASPVLCHFRQPQRVNEYAHPRKIIKALKFKAVSPLPALTFCTWKACNGTRTWPAFLPAGWFLMSPWLEEMKGQRWGDRAALS